MTKKTNNTSAPVAEANEQKKRKKQAKQEARMMLEIEEAKVRIQKAEKKLARAHVTLEARNTHLRTLETDLSDFRTSLEETEASAPGAGFDHQTEQPEPGEETIALDQHNGSDQETAQSKLEEITSSNQ